MAMDRNPELLERISALEAENKAIRKQLDILREQHDEAEHNLAPAFNALSLTGPDAACTDPKTKQISDERALELLGVEKYTHAPLSLRIFPRTELSLAEFEFETGDDKCLGKGAMGNVQLVRWISKPDAPLKALKRVSKFQMWKEDDPIMLFEQLWDEIEALLRLDHPNIVSLDGYFEDYRYVYLVLEYAPHGDLNQQLSHNSRIPVEDVVRHIQCLTQALIHCHSLNYLHRDVKPENLLISERGDLLLADFGCVATPHSSRKSLCGTRHYHSWEIVNEMPHDEASDAWSVGCVAFELLVGKSPFESDDEADQDDDEEEEEEEEVEDEEDEDEDHNEEEGDNDQDANRENDLEGNRESSDISGERDEEVAEDDEYDSDEDGSQYQDVADSDEEDDHSMDDQEQVTETSDEEEEDDDDDRSSSSGSSSDSSSEDEAEVEKIYSRIRGLEYHFPDYVGESARDFISKLLQKDKEKRMTLIEAIDHPFLKERS